MKHQGLATVARVILGMGVRATILRAAGLCAVAVCLLGATPQRAWAQDAARPAPRAPQKPAPAAKAPTANPPKPAGAAKAPTTPTAIERAKSLPAVRANNALEDKSQSKTQTDVREIKVLVAGGNEYRSFYSDWQSRGSTIVEGASKHLEKQCGLRFKVVGFANWEYKKAPRTADEAFRSLHKVPVGPADIVIGFTLVSFAGPRGEVRGLTQYFSQYVVIPDGWGVPGATTRLVHELSHVFGAFHVSEPDSVMAPGFEKTPRTFRFGLAADAVFPLTRNVKLQEGVGSLSAEAQQSLRSIYRQYHHPLEAIDEDPVVIGYRYQSLRSELAGDEARSAKMKAEMERVKAIAVDGALMKEEEPAPAKE